MQVAGRQQEGSIWGVESRMQGTVNAGFGQIVHYGITWQVKITSKTHKLKTREPPECLCRSSVHMLGAAGCSPQGLRPESSRPLAFAEHGGGVFSGLAMSPPWPTAHSLSLSSNWPSLGGSLRSNDTC